jgi:hypothetical protein
MHIATHRALALLLTVATISLSSCKKDNIDVGTSLPSTSATVGNSYVNDWTIITGPIKYQQMPISH